MHQTSEPITIHGFHETAAPGELRLTHWTRADRLRRAWTGLGICWGIAALAVFIPVAHFLLVPGFGIAGPVVFVQRWRRASSVHRVAGTCPDCQHTQEFHVTARPAARLEVRCAACGRGLSLARA